jgi:hypothetical protein
MVGSLSRAPEIVRPSLFWQHWNEKNLGELRDFGYENFTHWLGTTSPGWFCLKTPRCGSSSLTFRRIPRSPLVKSAEVVPARPEWARPDECEQGDIDRQPGETGRNTTEQEGGGSK